MTIKFVDASMDEFRAARRLERTRSPEVRELIQAMEELRPGQAKAVLLESGESAKTLRSRIAYAARAAGARVRIVIDDGRLMFRLRSSAGAGTQVGRHGAAARKAAVREAALALGRQSGEVSAEDVVAELDPSVLEGVRRPGTMVGAVLRSMDEFERVGQNRFRYAGSK